MTEVTQRQNALSRLSHREQLAQSLVSDMNVLETMNQRLLKRLKEKNLTIQWFDNQFLFENVYEVFAVATEKSLAEAAAIRDRTRTQLQRVQDWSLIHRSFKFLNKQKDIVAHMLENLDSPLYFGFLFLLNCRHYNYILKVYQLQENGSIVSCQLGSSKYKDHLRIAVFHSPHGPRFALLQKGKPAAGKRDEMAKVTGNEFPSQSENYGDLAKFDQNDKQVIRFVFDNFHEAPGNKTDSSARQTKAAHVMTDQEANIQMILATELGICPQLFVCYSEQIRDKEIMELKKKELGYLYHNIVKSVAIQSCSVAVASPAADQKLLPIGVPLEKGKSGIAFEKGRSLIGVDRKHSGVGMAFEKKGSLLNADRKSMNISAVDSKDVSGHGLQSPAAYKKKSQVGFSLKNLQEWDDQRPEVASPFNISNASPIGGRLSMTMQVPKGRQHNQLNSLISPRANPLVFSKMKRQESSVTRESNQPEPFPQLSYGRGMCPSMADVHDTLPNIMTLAKYHSVAIPSQVDVSRKPQVLEYNSQNRVTGTLKFYDETKKFGFIVADKDGQDIFFHFKDMEQNGIIEDRLIKNNTQRFSYVEMRYAGRRPDSKKAVDIKLLY